MRIVTIYVNGVKHLSFNIPDTNNQMRILQCESTIEGILSECKERYGKPLFKSGDLDHFEDVGSRIIYLFFDEVSHHVKFIEIYTMYENI